MLDKVSRPDVAPGRRQNIVGVTMHKARRARAIALAQDLSKVTRLRLLVVCTGAVAALLALPSLF